MGLGIIMESEKLKESTKYRDFQKDVQELVVKSFFDPIYIQIQFENQLILTLLF